MQTLILLLGEDRPAKEQRIAELKNRALSGPDAQTLDFESLQGDKADPATFKKSLLALPAISAQRLVLVRSAEKLNAQNKKILLEFLTTEPDHCVLILDVDASPAKNKFMDEIKTIARVERFGRGGPKINVFDMTRAMDERDPAKALKILGQLTSGGDHPLQIMGGLVWYWGQSKRRLTPERFKKGLLVLQEADLNIKRSRLKPDYAVELAVTKLSSLIAC